MLRGRQGRDKQEKRRSARIKAMEEKKEKERKERIAKEEEEEEEEDSQQGNEKRSDVPGDHFMYDNEDENSRAMKKGRIKWKSLAEIMKSTSTQPVQEVHYPGSGSSSRRNENRALEMNRRDTYKLPNGNSLFSGVLDAQSNLQLQYNENAGGGGYRESLLRFVKGMGPVAQRVAMQKLENMNYMEPMNDEFTDEHEPHAPPTQEGDFNRKVDGDAVVSSPKGP